MWSLGATVLPYIIAPFLVDLPQQHQSASTTVTWSTSSFIYDNNHGKKTLFVSMVWADSLWENVEIRMERGSGLLI
jgi:hypothetical protein